MASTKAEKWTPFGRALSAFLEIVGAALRDHDLVEDGKIRLEIFGFDREGDLLITGTALTCFRTGKWGKNGKPGPRLKDMTLALEAEECLIPGLNRWWKNPDGHALVAKAGLLEAVRIEIERLNQARVVALEQALVDARNALGLALQSVVSSRPTQTDHLPASSAQLPIRVTEPKPRDTTEPYATDMDQASDATVIISHPAPDLLKTQCWLGQQNDLNHHALNLKLIFGRAAASDPEDPFEYVIVPHRVRVSVDLEGSTAESQDRWTQLPVDDVIPTLLIAKESTWAADKPAYWVDTLERSTRLSGTYVFQLCTLLSLPSDVSLRIVADLNGLKVRFSEQLEKDLATRYPPDLEFNDYGSRRVSLLKHWIKLRDLAEMKRDGFYVLDEISAIGMNS